MLGIGSAVEMEFSPDGQVLAVVSEDGTLKIIDAANMKQVPLPLSSTSSLISTDLDQ
jgi:WD40 repeat protein